MRRNWKNPQRYQKGLVATLIAVIVLVATLLAATALIMSVDTNNVIAGNMSFRQGLVQEAEGAYAAAKANIIFTDPASQTDAAGVGYFSEIQAPSTIYPEIPVVLSPATSATPVGGIALAASVTGNQVHYVVERLCQASGPATVSPGINGINNTCIIPSASFSGGSVSGQTTDTGGGFGVAPAFRLSVRVDGPKGTVGYVQTILH